MRDRCPELEPLVQQWHGRTTRHVATGSGGASKGVEQHDGLDQGCPLNPALFAICFAPALSSLQESLRQLDLRFKAWAYLDDVCLTVPKAHLDGAIVTASRCFATLGLELNEGKTKVWCPGGMFAMLDQKFHGKALGNSRAWGAP